MNTSIQKQTRPLTAQFGRIKRIQLLWLALLGSTLFTSTLFGQAQCNWEVGTSYGFSLHDERKDFPIMIDFPNVGEMEKQSDHLFPGLSLTYRRFVNDEENHRVFATLEYNRNVIKYHREESAETLGVFRQQTDFTTRIHYLSLQIGFDFEVYRTGSHAFFLRTDLGYLTNIVNEVELITTRELSLSDAPKTDRYYLRENRFDKDTEDFTRSPFLVLGFQLAYEKSFSKTGFRAFVGVNVGVQEISNRFNIDYIDYITNNNFKLGGAYLF